MKAAFLTFLLLFVSNSFAQNDLRNLNDDLSELQLEQEAEEMELFDQDRH